MLKLLVVKNEANVDLYTIENLDCLVHGTPILEGLHLPWVHTDRGVCASSYLHR